MFQRERDEDVESFANGLEHNKVERNSGQSVEHAEDFAACSLRCTVAVTWQSTRRAHRFYLFIMRPSYRYASCLFDWPSLRSSVCPIHIRASNSIWKKRRKTKIGVNVTHGRSTRVSIFSLKVKSPGHRVSKKPQN